MIWFLAGNLSYRDHLIVLLDDYITLFLYLANAALARIACHAQRGNTVYDKSEQC